MPPKKKAERVSVFVRLSPAANQAIDEHAAQMGNVPRSVVVERAIERFVKETLPHNSGFMKRTARGETVLKKFKIERPLYEALTQAHKARGYTYQEMIRHAVGDLTGVY